MDQVCIPVPMPSEGKALELEVTVGGETHLMQYRIETLRWAPTSPPTSGSTNCARLSGSTTRGALVQIGSPGQGTVPIPFRRRPSTAAEAS